jgi:hypothetical protein
MSFRWRKRVGRCPVRANLSRRGVGWSIGFPGFRIGISASGWPYISIGLPGSGASYYKRLGGGRRR